MRTIYKYRLFSNAGVTMPAGAEILSVGEQPIGHDRYGLFLWARVDTAAHPVVRQVEIVGTGWEDRDGGDGKYVGTVQCRDGLVWHVFDHGEAKA